MARPLSALKSMLVSSVTKPRVVRFGLYSGIRMNLNLRTSSQMVFGLYEAELHPWFRRFSKGVATALDVGARHGENTLYFLKKTAAKKVFCFEPDTSAIPTLNENLALNNVTNDPRLQFIGKFAGAVEGPNATTLDTVIQGTDGPYFAKIDVEGGELDVLTGSETLLARNDVKLIIETHSKELEAACVQFLNARGYATRIVRPAFWRLVVPEHRPGSHNQWLVAEKTQAR